MSNRKTVTQELSKFLADTYILYLKTQNYHWNVSGPQFYALHLLFEKQYEDLAEAADLIAERIRALDEKTPASFAAFQKLTSIKEETGFPSEQEMLRNLAEDHKTLAASAEAVLKAAEKSGDDSTADLAIQRQRVHQKNHWMLAAHFEESQATSQNKRAMRSI